MEEPSLFNQIPERILLKIFNLLDLKSLAKARCICRRFNDVITANWKYLPKPRKAFKILAAKDDQGNPTVEFHCNDPEEFKVCCSATEISAKHPFYYNWGVNLEKHPHYSKRWLKEQAFRHSFSRTVSDGREFDDSHPLPAISFSNAFEEALNFYFSHFNVDRLDLTEYDRSFTVEEMNLILQCVKANRTTVSSISRQIETLDDVLIELVKRTKCNDFTFCAYFDNPKSQTADNENSVEKRITELSCENMYIYETGFISIEKILELIQQWADATRSIERYNIHHSEMGLDWFPLVSSLQNIQLNSEPEDIIWTMNATVHLKTFSISRKSDGERLDFHYWDSYVEIRHYKPPEPYFPKNPKYYDDKDEDFEFFDFGLFD